MTLFQKEDANIDQEARDRKRRFWLITAGVSVLAVVAAVILFTVLSPKKADDPVFATSSPAQQSGESAPALMASPAPETPGSPSFVQTAKPETQVPESTLTPESTLEPTSTPSFTNTPAPTGTPKPEVTPSPEKTPDSIESAAQMLLAKMSLEEKIYQMFIVTPEQLRGSGGTVTQIDSVLQAALQQRPVGGVICFEGHIRTPAQTTGLLAGLQTASRLGLFIAVDEEGGRVARLGKNSAMGTTAFPPMLEIGESGSTENARNVGRTIGKEIKPFGFNLDLAPVADVFSNPNNPAVGNRCFSRDPRIAAEMVAACVEGFKESGMLCTLKHFPGHGDTETDTHYGAAISNKTLKELQECEFLPFQAGIAAGADVIMIAHLSLPNVTGNDLPATLSREIITGLLREQLGFNGLIITDAMNMEAITKYFSPGEAAVMTIQAGTDIVLMPNDLSDAVNGVLSAVKNGKLSEARINESVYRILHAKLEQGIIPMSSVR